MPEDHKDIQQDAVNRVQGVAADKRRITQGDPQGHRTQDTSPTEQINPEVRSGAGVDIDSRRMPADGVLEVHDSDDEILNEEKRHDISSNGPREGSEPE